MFAQKVAGAVTRVIAAHRKNPHAHERTARVTSKDGQFQVEARLEATTRGGRLLTVSYVMPHAFPSNGGWVAASQYYVRIQKGQYRLVPKAKYLKFFTRNHLPAKTRVYMRNILSRAIQLYNAHPLATWS